MGGSPDEKTPPHTRSVAISRQPAPKGTSGRSFWRLRLRSGFALPAPHAPETFLILIDGRSHLDCRAAHAAVFEDADLVGGAVHLDRPAPRRVGHAVEIAINGDHAVLGDAALQAQHGLERSDRQLLEAGTLLGEMLRDDAAGGGVGAEVGDLVEPLAELAVEVV